MGGHRRRAAIDARRILAYVHTYHGYRLRTNDIASPRLQLALILSI